MKIKVEPFLMKQGNKVARAAIEFNEGVLKGFHLLGFTICDDEKKGLFVLFPSSQTNIKNEKTGKNRNFFFLKPENDELIDKLEKEILDVYENMMDTVKR